MKYDLQELPSKTRSRIIRSRVPYRFREDNLTALDTYTGETKVKVDHWLELLHGGKVIVASGERDTCGKGLLIEGPPGTGKTLLASALATAVLRDLPDTLWRERWNRADHIEPLNPRNPVMYFTYPEILATIKRGWDRALDDADREMMDSVFGHGKEINKVRLLVIDDLGKEHKGASDWSTNTFDHLLRERFDAGLPTIVTTNVPMKDWARDYGEAMGSFAHDAFFSVPLDYGTVGDRRKARKAS